ncbi:lysophospholipase L1-like esterase [Marinoscillum furvescens DSM 4134]|uniref:Lysophospholipase L1-like esterase n=2 Tax=Marinoscillum furvescens TaxID=1026 RepID=A0A3D9L7Q8_MARFU|nr:lysophospholipase L1-like esterase [Marinoscillum furvescens DSM 4134]
MLTFNVLYGMMKQKLAAILMFLGLSAAEAQDWPDLQKYRSANKEAKLLPKENRKVVFMGNSITEAWISQRPEFFSENGFIGRGISGQTTPQMLLRFRQDVIDLQPKAVVILAGTNDVAQNTGPMTIEESLANIKSMVELAQANGITPVLCTVLPADRFSWRPELTPAETIIALNQLIKQYAEAQGLALVDYHAALTNKGGGLPVKYGEDGVHPNVAGYQVMENIVLPVISSELAKLK